MSCAASWMVLCRSPLPLPLPPSSCTASAAKGVSDACCHAQAHTCKLMRSAACSHLQASHFLKGLREVQCSAVQCSAVQCSAVQCSAVQCSAVQCSVVQCCTALRCAVLCHALLCCAVLTMSPHIGRLQEGDRRGGISGRWGKGGWGGGC